MAKPNYSFEKRQREQQKRQKKEQKEKERADRKSGVPTGDGSEGQAPDAAQMSEAPVEPAVAPASSTT